MCKVKDASGHYPDFAETVPYAVKIYKKDRMKGFVNNTNPTFNEDGTINQKSLGMISKLDALKNETKVWGKLDHKNVVKVFMLYDNMDIDTMYLLMQKADAGQLADIDESTHLFKFNPKVEASLRKFVSENPGFGSSCRSEHERICKRLFQQVAAGLRYLHETANVVNRDIKPENILYATQEFGTNPSLEDRAQLADFTTGIELPSNRPDYMISG